MGHIFGLNNIYGEQLASFYTFAAKELWDLYSQLQDIPLLSVQNKTRIQSPVGRKF
jgi:hypothetical protein